MDNLKEQDSKNKNNFIKHLRLNNFYFIVYL